MPLSDRESFKVAVLQKCAEAGFTIEETHAIVKEALEQVKTAGPVGDFFGKVLKAPIDVGTHVLKRTADYGIPLALFGPPVLGYGAGRMLAKATDIGDEDVDAMKQRELVQLYEQSQEQLRRKKKLEQALGNV